MSLVTLLLLVILLLLAAIVFMLVTGWPGAHRRDIEKAASSLRREMAEHRSDSMRLMQVIRTEVEDAVQESLDRELAALAGNRGMVSPPAQPSAITPRIAGQGSPPAGSGIDSSSSVLTAAAAAGWAETEALRRSRQLSLFTSPPESAETRPPEGPQPASVDTPPVQKESGTEGMVKVDAVLHDDIPDMGDIPDLDDLD